jgi:glycosyltransferase involved in cell wall biosynthesis
MTISLPKISIITPSLNQGRYIEQNILSVINQKYACVEHWIIDGGSTDNTLNVIRKYERQLKWISEPDGGQSVAVNKGFVRATGDIIGWVNSDDRLCPDALHKIGRFFLNNPDEIAVVGDQIMIDEHGNRISTVVSEPYNFDYLVNKSKGITQNSIFFKRCVFEQTGYLDESLHYSMDTDFFIRVTMIREIPHVNTPLAEFRKHRRSKTFHGSYNFAKERIRIRRKYKGRVFDVAGRADFYIIFTQPLRQLSWFRMFFNTLRNELWRK